MINCALSNAIGSNVFDILIGLGLPWLLRIIMSIGSPSTLVKIHNERLALTAVALLSSVLLLGCLLDRNKWQLNLSTGIACLVIYAGFICVSVTIEMLS